MYTLLASSSDTVFKVLSAAGTIGTLVVMVLFFLLRRSKEREDTLLKARESQNEEARQALRNYIDGRVDNLASQIAAIKNSLTDISDNIKSHKASLPPDLVYQSQLGIVKTEILGTAHSIRKDLTRIKDTCSKKHERILSAGNLSDLKARVDEMARRLEKLSDLQGSAAEKYVLLTNYQQDIKMLTDTVSMLRQDLRVVLEMLDKLR